MRIKYNIVKFVYSIIGFFKSLTFKKGRKYFGGININANSVYRGKRTFYESLHDVEPTYGVCVFKTRMKTYKYWEIGLFKWIALDEMEEDENE